MLDANFNGLCLCETPKRPTGREPERLLPYICLVCGGYACEYAGVNKKVCPPTICDCFVSDLWSFSGPSGER